MALANETCDFKATEDKARTMTDDALAAIVKDCYEAAQAAEELVRAGIASNPGKYWDEMCTYGDELARRKNARKSSR